MKVTLITYNVLFNKACFDLKEILDEYHPQIICLQEVDTNLDNLFSLEKYGYQLADFSNSFVKFGIIYGVATFYDPHVFNSSISDRMNLPKSFIEFFLTLWRFFKGGNEPRTVLETNLLVKDVKQTISIYNTHLSAYATNRARIGQIKKTVKSTLEKNNPVIIVGDFNYFYGRKKLETIMNSHGLQEATNQINYSFERAGEKWRHSFFEKILALIGKIFTSKLTYMKFDYIFYKNIKHLQTKRIDVKFSDHFPIYSEFEL